MSQNPYAPPSAQVADQTIIQRGTYVPGGHGVAATRGWDWITEAWGLFKASPGMWIAMVVVFFVIYMVLAFIPFIGGLLSFLAGPLFGAGFVIGCRAIEDGQELEFKHLFEGFSQRFGPLCAVGALYLAAWIGVILVVALVTGAGVMALLAGSSGQAGDVPSMAALTTILLGVLIAMALMLPVVMAVWFAPSLVVFHDLGPIEAMKDSFTGCVRNIVPFLVYGIVYLVLAFIATIPLGLGWLVLGPMTAASVYTAYRDIYLA
jgi:uncharacterized membrane protein